MMEADLIIGFGGAAIVMTTYAVVVCVRIRCRALAPRHARLFIDLAERSFADPKTPVEVKRALYKLTQRIDDVSILCSVVDSPVRGKEGKECPFEQNGDQCKHCILRSMPKKALANLATAIHHFERSLMYQSPMLGLRYQWRLHAIQRAYPNQKASTRGRGMAKASIWSRFGLRLMNGLRWARAKARILLFMLYEFALG